MSSHLVPVYPPTTYAVLPIVAAALSELAAGRTPAGYVRPVAISTPVMASSWRIPSPPPNTKIRPTDPRRRARRAAPGGDGRGRGSIRAGRSAPRSARGRSRPGHPEARSRLRRATLQPGPGSRTEAVPQDARPGAAEGVRRPGPGVTRERGRGEAVSSRAALRRRRGRGPRSPRRAPRRLRSRSAPRRSPARADGVGPCACARHATPSARTVSSIGPRSPPRGASWCRCP